MTRSYWLMKSEPNTYSWDDLVSEPDKTTFWDGVRNYQARNLLRDTIKKGDGVLFYHSSCKPQIIAGTAKVVKEGYPDPTQFDRKSKYYDVDSPPNEPRWYGVDIKADRGFKNEVTLVQLKETPGLEDMMLLRRGARLSVQPVTPEQWAIILELGGLKKR